MGKVSVKETTNTIIRVGPLDNGVWDLGCLPLLPAWSSLIVPGVQAWSSAIIPCADIELSQKLAGSSTILWRYCDDVEAALDVLKVDHFCEWHK